MWYTTTTCLKDRGNSSPIFISDQGFFFIYIFYFCFFFLQFCSICKSCIFYGFLTNCLKDRRNSSPILISRFLLYLYFFLLLFFLEFCNLWTPCIFSGFLCDVPALTFIFTVFPQLPPLNSFRTKNSVYYVKIEIFHNFYNF